MSDSAAALPAAMPHGEPYFEQRIFMRSPLGTLGTIFVLFAALYGSYLLAAWLGGLAPIRWTSHSVTLTSGAWPALVLSLLICASLGMQRYARLKDAQDYENFAPIFTGGAHTAQRLVSYAPQDANLTRATAVGLLAGTLISAAVARTEHLRFDRPALPTSLWILVAIFLVSMLFARGAELSGKSSKSFAQTLREELKIDLLRMDRLSVIGRSAARTALIWIVVSAVASLFFVGGDITPVSVGTMVACAAMGVAIFLRAIVGVHRRVKDAKAVELDRLREQIHQIRETMPHDAAAAQRVHGLLAYEARIAGAPEWPFDQSTLLRVGASTLIVTIPWFGQAIVGYAVDHFAH